MPHVPSMGPSRLLFLLGLGAACTNDHLLGPFPSAEPHFTAIVDGTPFVGFMPDDCIGMQVTPTMFFMSGRIAGSFPTPEISISLGGISGPTRVAMRPNEVQSAQRSALYIPDDPARLQYSAPTFSGDILIDEYDPVHRTVAGRFFFNAHREVGTEGPEWVAVREGSFRGRLRSWGSQFCD